VDSRSLLFEPVRGSLRAGATRTPNIAGTQPPISHQSPGLNETKNGADLNARQPELID
jgi:hypothetical protein